MHTCKPTGCRCTKDGTCKYKFPFAPHEKMTEYDGTTKRFLYYRAGPPPGYTEHAYGPHRNVVPYHPTFLLLWNAHMNVQRITHQAWSLYILKYALKAEPSGPMTLDTATATSLGLGNMSDAALQVMSNLVFANVISLTEAAFAMLGKATVEASEPVHYVDTRSRKDRSTMIIPAAQQICIPPIEHYCARPASLDGITIYQYYR